MPLKKLFNLTTGTLNPSGQTNVLPGGAGSQTTGSTANPGMAGPRVEEAVMECIDVSKLAPAASGNLVVLDRTKSHAVSNQGCYQFTLSAGEASVLPRGTWGIVTTPAPITGSKAIIQYEGPCLALCTADAGITVAPGSLLQSDGLGGLEAVTSPAAGVCLAVSMGTVSNTETPTLIPVLLGGF